MAQIEQKRAKREVRVSTGSQMRCTVREEPSWSHYHGGATRLRGGERSVSGSDGAARAALGAEICIRAVNMFGKGEAVEAR